MKFKYIFQSLFIAYAIVASFVAFGQTLDSKILIREIEMSNNNTFLEYLKRYDDYLRLHPNDVTIQIEKCKFLQKAQYNEQEEYNPNQEAFDSCFAALAISYPEQPDVLIFQTENKWGDELKSVFADAKASIQKKPNLWTDENLGFIYKAISDQDFVDEDYEQSYNNLLDAISKDSKYENTLEHAEILLKLKKNKEALKVLLAIPDTTKMTWQLTRKADMLLELKAYTKALELYSKISNIDSNYNNNLNIASTLEKVGQIGLAREMLVASTTKGWQKEVATHNLLLHDLEYENGTKCIESYNKFRDFGISYDPIGIYRLKIFFQHPFQPWTFRDILGVLLFTFTILLLVLIPSIWILPVYFVGHQWNFLNRVKHFKSDWGLKSFWFVSFGFLFASFVTFFVEPGVLNAMFSTSNLGVEASLEKEGLTSMVFIIVFAFFGIAALYKKNLKVLLSSDWSVQKSIFTGLGILFVYRIAISLYARLGVGLFDISINDLGRIPQLFLASRQDIVALINYSGKGISFIIICLLVPLYEEIIFRGVILGSCQKYTNFQIANFIQALLFAIIHMNLFLFPVFLLFGIIVGILRKQSGGLLSGIVFHMANNFLAISVILLK